MIPCCENFLAYVLCGACRESYHTLFVAFLTHFSLSEIFSVTAEHDIRTASCHVCGDCYRAELTCLSYDIGFHFVVLRVEDGMRYACAFELL